MLIKDLIKQLEDLYERRLPGADIMGEPSIEIDVFRKKEGTDCDYEYAGVMTHMDIKFGQTPDGVYDVLTAFADDYPRPIR